MRIECEQQRAHGDFVELSAGMSSLRKPTGPIGQTTPSSDSRNLIKLCVDGVQPDLSGRIFTMYGEDAIEFSDTAAMLRWIDAFLDELDFPMSDTKRRKFGKHKDSPDLERNGGNKVPQCELSSERGGKGTFLVKVHSRQKSTWQGTVQWVEGNLQQSFQTMLELLRIIDGTLDVRKKESRINGRSELFGDVYKMRRSEKGNFLVRVQYQQNSTWQGTVQWVEGGQKKPFRSTLELLLLIDSVFHTQEEECLEVRRMCD